MLDLIGISKSYLGVQALDRVDFSLAEGEVVGLIGENGAGKSTLMKILGGVVEPSSGTIRLDGRNYASLTVGDANATKVYYSHATHWVTSNRNSAIATAGHARAHRDGSGGGVIATRMPA